VKNLPTRKGRYKLATQIGHFAFYGEVEVEVELAELPGLPRVQVVHVDPKGPCSDLDWKGATSFGIQLAASKLGRELIGKGLLVKVMNVHGMVADTGLIDLAFAAAFAFWDAVGYVPKNPPRVDTASLSFVFPR